MKRAEALQKLQEYLDINAGQLVPEQILKFVENLGMRPPGVSGDLSRAIADIYMFPDFNQWEEDVEKDEQVMTKAKRHAEIRAEREARREKK